MTIRSKRWMLLEPDTSKMMPPRLMTPRRLALFSRLCTAAALGLLAPVLMVGCPKYSKVETTPASQARQLIAEAQRAEEAGDKELAQRLYSESMDRSPLPAAKLGLARYYSDKGDYARAAAYLNDLKESGYSNREVEILLAQAESKTVSTQVEEMMVEPVATAAPAMTEEVVAEEKVLTSPPETEEAASESVEDTSAPQKEALAPEVTEEASLEVEATGEEAAETETMAAIEEPAVNAVELEPLPIPEKVAAALEGAIEEASDDAADPAPLVEEQVETMEPEIVAVEAEPTVEKDTDAQVVMADDSSEAPAVEEEPQTIADDRFTQEELETYPFLLEPELPRGTKYGAVEGREVLLEEDPVLIPRRTLAKVLKEEEEEAAPEPIPSRSEIEEVMFSDARSALEERALASETALVSDPQFYLRRGRQALSEGNLVRARAQFMEALTVEPDNLEALIELADVYEQMGRSNQARNLLARAENLAPKNPRVYYKTGNSYLRRQRPKDAIRYYQEALKLNPSYTYALHNAGVASMQSEQWATARDYLQRTVQVDPNYAPAYRNLGILAEKQAQDPRAAIRYYQKYIELGGVEADVVKGWIEELEAERRNRSSN